jgi:hypothetical protein
VILGGEYDERDRRQTPIGPQFSDRIAARLVEAELQSDVIHHLPWWLSYPAELAMGWIITSIFKRWTRQPLRAAAVVFSIAELWALAAVSASYLGAFWLEAGVFLAAITIEHHIESVRNANELARAPRVNSTQTTGRP